MENACMHDTGEFLMKIIKIVNNNIVTSLDEQNREIIVMGRGLGFGRKPGMTIDDGKVEKVFRLNSAGENQKLVDIIQDIPLEHIKVADQIIEYAKNMLGEKLKETIYLSLIDHIDGAIERYENQIQFANPLLWEIKQYYPSEFKVGVQSLNILKKMLGIELPVDEAAFIALHFITAEYDTKMDVTFDIPRLIDDIIAIVESEFSIKINKESIHYERFITHLKFFARRIVGSQKYGDEDTDLLEVVRFKYPCAFACAEKICSYVLTEKGFRAGDNELLYLTIHIARVMKDN